MVLLLACHDGPKALSCKGLFSTQGQRDGLPWSQEQTVGTFLCLFAHLVGFATIVTPHLGERWWVKDTYTSHCLTLHFSLPETKRVWHCLNGQNDSGHIKYTDIYYTMTRSIKIEMIEKLEKTVEWRNISCQNLQKILSEDIKLSS